MECEVCGQPAVQLGFTIGGPEPGDWGRCRTHTIDTSKWNTYTFGEYRAFPQDHPEHRADRSRRRQEAASPERD